MKYLPFLTVIAFHRVKKSQLIIGIVDRIKIHKEQLFPFSDSELSHTFLKLQVLFTSVSFISRRQLRIFCNICIFFKLLYFIIFFYTFFTHDIYPHPHPHPRPTTHDIQLHSLSSHIFYQFQMDGSDSDAGKETYPNLFIELSA